MNALQVLYKQTSEHSHWALAAVLLFACSLRLLSFVGVVGSDDVTISGLAQRLTESGPWVPEGHYQARLGLIVPLALIYELFGVGEWQTVAIPFALSLVGIVLAYLITARLFTAQAGVLAALTLAVFPLDVVYASQLMPDLPLGVLLAGAFYGALRALDSKRYLPWAITAGSLWGLAYFVKVEAVFLGIPMLLLLGANFRGWRRLVWVFSVPLLAFALESLAYFVGGGEVVQRLSAVTSTGSLSTTEEFGATQLWVFPKAWFITVYDFALHYYFMLGAAIWVFLARVRGLYIIVAWVLVYLLWLQFGGNPFAEHYNLKSHLNRYCNMINVPMAVLVGAMLATALQRSWRVGAALVLVMSLAGLFFINFNTLSAERQVATKQAIDYARSGDLFPLYMDRTSYAIASIYMYSSPRWADVEKLQEYDFERGETRVLDPADLDGYALLNRGFMDYAWNRYRIDKVHWTGSQDGLREVYRVDNPGNPLAYLQARLLYGLSRLIPVWFLREKVGDTAQYLLEGGDVVIVEPTAK